MRVLMLGWEFPPFIAGGLGVACQGLTRALDQLGHEITFILPKPIQRGVGGAGGVESLTSSIRMLGPTATYAPAPEVFDESGPHASADAIAESIGVAPVEAPAKLRGERLAFEGFAQATFLGVPAAFESPYPWFQDDGPSDASDEEVAARLAEAQRRLREASDQGREALFRAPPPPPLPTSDHALGAEPSPMASKNTASMPSGFAFHHYGTDLVGDADRYARLVVGLARGHEFDVVHAHDWLTFPAAIAISQLTRRPLIVHVHSTEFDRAGSTINQAVYDIERAGMLGADRVIAVSQFTKSICVRRYGVPESKIDVVYNGLDREQVQPRPDAVIKPDDKIVLFLGRITQQKGPEYFIAAAARVVERLPNVKFVLAGSGDMALRMMELAVNMGIGEQVLFTGFLKSKDVERVFQLADCYVMPSVSEPFGLAALEALSHDVPTIVSKTSGVSEVLSHVLKVDFWDIDEMANKILAVLRYPPLGKTLRHHAGFELERLTWSSAAESCVQVYHGSITARAAARPA